MRRARLFLVCALSIAWNTSASSAAVTDDFSDGNDTANPAWTRLDGAVGSTGQTWDASSGGYRLTAPGNSEVEGVGGYGFVGGYVGPSYTDVRVSTDIIDFPNVGMTGSYFGVAAHMNGDNSQPGNNGIALHGYSYQYEASARGGLGEMVLNILHGGGLRDIGSQAVTLDNSKDYRFVLEIMGNTLHGQVFELGAGGSLGPMVAEKIRNLDVEPVGNLDHDGNPLTPAQPFVPYASGYSGVFGVGYVFLSPADFTIDNFKAESLISTPGDFDHDGDVDGNDLTAWKGAYGSTNVGDADGDGDSDGADFLKWQQQWTGSLPARATAAAIPEPSGLYLLAIASLLVSARRQRMKP